MLTSGIPCRPTKPCLLRRAYLVELLPILLLGLTDEDLAIRTATMERLQQISERCDDVNMQTATQVLINPAGNVFLPYLQFIIIVA